MTNRQLAFQADGEENGPLRLDPTKLEILHIYGSVQITDDALQLLWTNEVEVSWLSAAGAKCRGRLVRTDSRKTTLRIRQHRILAQPTRQLQCARWIVERKIESQVKAARHYQRHGSLDTTEVLERLTRAREQCQSANLESLRGIEGSTSAEWFALLGRVIKKPWSFTARVRRPPTDPVNAMLSLGYTWVLNRISAQIQAAGLEVNLGALHDYRPGRPSLACDLMEPLRVPGVDRWIVGLFNQDRISEEAFVNQDGAIRLQPSVFGQVLADWEKHWTKGKLTEEMDEMIAEFMKWLTEVAGEEKVEDFVEEDLV
jgi:CRISPR-associated protein Cas1